MSIVYYDNEYGQEFDLDTDTKSLCVFLLDNTLDYLQCEYDAECSLVITTTDDIHEYNLSSRGIDSATDVLSFPAIDFQKPCDYSIIDENNYTMFNPDTGCLMLGDIVISYEHVLKQAEEYAHTVKRELSFLILHSILHLFGYDHMTDEDRVIMEEVQKDILNELGITR